MELKANLLWKRILAFIYLVLKCWQTTNHVQSFRGDASKSEQAAVLRFVAGSLRNRFFAASGSVSASPPPHEAALGRRMWSTRWLLACFAARKVWLHPVQVDWSGLLSLHGRPELGGLGLVTDLTNRSEGRDCKQKLNSVALVPSRPLGHLDFAQCVSHNVPTEGDTSSANTPLISGTQMIYTNIRTPKKI